MKPHRSLPTALCAALLATSLSIRASAAEPSPTPEVQAHFKAGVALLKAQQNEEALREFKAAYAITPRRSVLFNIAYASERLERDGEAIDAYKEYLDRGRSELDAKETARVEHSIQRLGDGIATVTLDAPGTFWIIDTRTDASAPVVTQYGPFEGRAELRVRAGQHEIKLDRASLASTPWLVPLRARDRATHSFEPEAPAIVETFGSEPVGQEPAPEVDIASPTHTASYVLWGVGAAGAIATTVFSLEAHSVQSTADSDFARHCPLGATGADGCEKTTAGSERAAHWRTGALLTGIGAVGALVGGTVLYFLDGRPSSAAGAAEGSVQAWVSPTGIGVTGTF